jgi:hypothetical protein
MADDPPPPPPPQFFSARNEQKGVLIGRAAAPAEAAQPPVYRSAPARPMLRVDDQASDSEALFLQCMADAARRRIAFNVVERNCREALARGDEGLALFLRLRDLVERAQVEEAIREFDGRFAPMLDQELINERLRTR